MPAPLTDPVIFAMARLVDDAQSETREPSHSDIDFQVARVKLQSADPKAQANSSARQNGSEPYLAGRSRTILELVNR
jgi:hypothetical protein